MGRESDVYLISQTYLTVRSSSYVADNNIWYNYKDMLQRKIH